MKALVSLVMIVIFFALSASAFAEATAPRVVTEDEATQFVTGVYLPILSKYLNDSGQLVSTKQFLQTALDMLRDRQLRIKYWTTYHPQSRLVISDVGRNKDGEFVVGLYVPALLDGREKRKQAANGEDEFENLVVMDLVHELIHIELYPEFKLKGGEREESVAWARTIKEEVRPRLKAGKLVPRNLRVLFFFIGALTVPVSSTTKFKVLNGNLKHGFAIRDVACKPRVFFNF
jgi:hypothetical protein